MTINTDEQKLQERAATLIKEIKGIPNSTIKKAIQINKAATELLQALENMTVDIQPDNVNRMTKRMKKIDQWLFIGESMKDQSPHSVIDLQDEMDQPLKTIWNKYKDSLWFDTQAMSQLNNELNAYHQKTLNIPKEINALKEDLKWLNSNYTLLKAFKELLINIVKIKTSVWLKK